MSIISTAPNLPTATVDNLNDPSQETQDLHRKLSEWWTQAREVQSINRYQMAIDADFKDGIQWRTEDSEVLQERGQASLVYNKIKPAIDWILGTEKRTRIDFNVYPRKKEANKEAEAKKELLKFISDVNKVVFARSRAFDDAVTVGVGWLEDSICNDNTKERIQSRYESWRNVWYDPTSVERDLSDSRYLFRSKFIDLDIATAMFPKFKVILEAACTTINHNGSEQGADDDYFYALQYQQRDSQGNIMYRQSFSSSSMVYNRRKRVKLIECWYRDPITKKVMRGGEFDGQDYDDNNEFHKGAVQEEYASVVNCLVMQMNVAIMIDSHILQQMKSPYDHNDFPLTPIWGFRRSRDNAPYGVTRSIRDPQESLNKRMSKALHILSTNQIIAEQDAATDWDNIKDEAGRPDGILLLDGRKGARFEINNDKQLAEEHIKLMDIDAKMIQDVSGVTDENMGRGSNATSGVAIGARQEQGSVVTAELFDNLRYAVQLQGEKQLSLVEQFHDDPMLLRVIGAKGGSDFLPINTPEWDDQSGTWVMLNPITASKADFVVDEQDYQASMRQAMFDTMNKMLQTLQPEVALQLLDLVYDNSDLPGRDEIVARIRKLNGQSDPNAEQTPEELQAQKAKEAEAQKQQDQQQALLELDIKTKQAQLDKLIAEKQNIDANKTKTNVTALFESTQAGQIAVNNPSLAPVYDKIYKISGGVEYNESQPIEPSFADQTQQQPPQQPQGQLTQPPRFQQNTHPNYPANPVQPDEQAIQEPMPTMPSPGLGEAQGIETMRND
jgi:hypothetical protein